MSDKDAFFALLRAGLWEKEARLPLFDGIDFNEVYRLAEEQSVVGLVAAGMEHVTNVKIPQTTFLFFVGTAIQMEQRNKAMNAFVARLIERLRNADIYAILVKGQGIAQCYERPLWRACGDVDLLLSEENYEKAKALLLPQATSVEREFVFLKHLGMTILGWEVELHGTQRPRLTKRIDRVVDEVQEDVFCGGKVRSWMNGRTQVFLPAPDEDVIFVFTHILHHYYQEGIGLRQICDWCRLLYTYRDTLNVPLLESRLKKAGLMSEWKAFAAFAVEYLGMPVEVIPLYDENDNHSDNLKRKTERICQFVMECGNFGHNRRSKNGNTLISQKASSLWRRTTDCFRHFTIFPINSLKVWWYMVWTGFKVVRGE